MRSSRSKTTRHAKPERSVFTEEDKRLVGSLVVKRRQYESSLELKSEEFDE